jgi:hypothetical protein
MAAAYLRRVFFAAAALALLPIWSAKYLPTVDGPSHVYNSWVLQQLLAGRGGVVAQTFMVDWQPHPNWSGHAVLALLMTVFSPPVAEKILVSGIVLLFFFAVWQYAGCVDPGRRTLALFAAPFAYSLLLQMGFYNFCIGAALYFLLLATWWRRRDLPDARTILLTAALLLACYFSHLMPAMLAAGSLGILWLATLPGRPLRAHARHLLALVPLLPLVAWFLGRRGASLAVPAHADAAGLFSYLQKMWVILTFDDYQARLGVWLFAFLAAAIVVTFLRRRWRWDESDAFILVTLAVVVLYARAPASSSGGTMVFERMALFVVLSPLAWLDLRLPRRASVALTIALAVLSLAYTGYLTRRYRTLSKRMADVVRTAGAIGRDSTFLALVRDARPPGTYLPILAHAAGYAAIEKGAADIGDYEAATEYFPIAFRPGRLAPNILTLPTATTAIDWPVYAPRAGYVVLWHVPDDSPLLAGLDASYVEVSSTAGGRVMVARNGGP